MREPVNTIRREDLLAASFPQPTEHIEVCETHLSFVVLADDVAYKIKKALKFDFVDASSLDKRRALCEEEMRLNRRYAPDIYLGVVPVVSTLSGLGFEQAGAAVEYAVKMRRFERDQEMQSLLSAGAVKGEDVAALAERLCAIHQTSRVLRDNDLKGTQAFTNKARENLNSVAARASLINADAEVMDLSAWTQDTLDRLIEHLRERERTGFIRECHGDLHTGNIVRWKGVLMPFDSIEFDPDLRYIDTLSDLAFLFMDLSAKQHEDLAHTLLNRYLECTGDYKGAYLLSCFYVYRALVRVKVELISLEQHPQYPESADCARSFLAAARAAAAKQNPSLVLMHGASGSGKSWLSGQLVPVLPGVRIRSDLERKRIAGIDPAEFASKAPADIYSLEFNNRTYTHLLECARNCLRGGINVIVDAAFLKARERADFASMARAQGAAFSILSCAADPRTLSARIAQRRAARNDPSDADEKVMLRQLQTMEPFAREEAKHVAEVDTGSADALSKALEHVRAAASPS